MKYIKYSDSSQYISRGDIYYADLSPVVGSEQGGIRPVLVVQNNMGNRYSPTVIVAAITSCTTKAKIPTHVAISKEESGLRCDSTILLEQVRTIDRSRLKEYIGRLSDRQMGKVDKGLLTSLGLADITGTVTLQARPAAVSCDTMQRKEAAALAF